VLLNHEELVHEPQAQVVIDAAEAS
jgi:hypothetical protein